MPRHTFNPGDLALIASVAYPRNPTDNSLCEYNANFKKFLWGICILTEKLIDPVIIPNSITDLYTDKKPTVPQWKSIGFCFYTKEIIPPSDNTCIVYEDEIIYLGNSNEY